MVNRSRYVNVFVSVFDTVEDAVSGMKYQDSEGWDSVGHMNLISALEDEFDIMFDTEDILAFDSFETGISIMTKYGVEI